MIKLERLQQDKEMIIQQDVYQLINIFKDLYQSITVDLSKQKELDVDPRAIQQIEFCGMLKTNLQLCTVFEKQKKTVLEFYKGAAKVL